MFLLVSIGIFFQSISLHYQGDSNIEKLLFSGTNQLKKIDKCKDNCVSIKVKGKKVRMILRDHGESLEKRYDFSRNRVSEAQFADLLRLKIILFRKEYKKKIEKKLKLIESKTKSKVLAKLKGNKEKKDKTLRLQSKILKNKEKKELEFKLKEELQKKLDISLNKQIEKELEKELDKRIKNIIEDEFKYRLDTMKNKLKKEIILELKNERLKNQYSEIILSGNLNLGIKKDEFAAGLLLEYKQIDNSKITSYSVSYLIGEELNKIRTDFILLQLAMGHKFDIYKDIDIELMFGGFSTIVNLLDSNDEWFIAWDTTGGILSSVNISFLITQNWGLTLKSDFFLFLVSYRNTENDGLYGNKNMSIGFYLGSFIRF